MNISVVIGAQSLRSAGERVIQFNVITSALTPVATHPVHTGQFGQRPSADKMDKAKPAKMKMDTPAMMRPDRGNGPSI
jgi:hypothetical protein